MVVVVEMSGSGTSSRYSEVVDEGEELSLLHREVRALVAGQAGVISSRWVIIVLH